MQNTSLESELARMASDPYAPPDDKQHRIYASHLILNDSQGSSGAFYELLDALLDEIAPLNRKSLRAEYRACGEGLLLNLSKAGLSRRWLCISGNRSHYLGNPIEVFPNFNTIDRWLKYLVKHNLVHKLTGKKYKENPVWNRYYPTPAFLKQIIRFSLSLESPIEPPYWKINQPEEAFERFELPEGHEERVFLEEINGFAKGQSWALKGPIKQVLTKNPLLNGRLLTAFQNIPNRSYKIRSNTLINDNPLAEIDFNANHLRIFLVYHEVPYVGDDPYAEIASYLGLTRSEVKGFITIALNSDSFNKAASAAKKSKNIDWYSSKLIDEFLTKEYPKINFYCQFGLDAMRVEGDVLSAVMRFAMEDGIFCLPIHDAVAVEHQYAEEIKELMIETWEYELQNYWSLSKEIKSKIKAAVKVS